MSAPVDHTGKTFGCLHVVRKAPSRKMPSGGTAAYWVVRCVCGNEKEMKAQALISRDHASCEAPGCSLRWDAPLAVQCATCSAEYQIKRGSSVRGFPNVCMKCRAEKASAATRGKPAHNRLPGDSGAFNDLFSRYKQGAKNRGLTFNIESDAFRRMTQQPCHYCAAAPSQVSSRSKGNAPAYTYNGIDRLNPALGYVDGNVVPCCAACNYMKQEMTIDEFINRVNLIASRLRQ